ncbi:MAG: hypothetical protein FWH57_09065 [Oscillospiraceae bacterium]|nr:hypothetical protein [Oscillospiraceae bacterium]
MNEQDLLTIKKFSEVIVVTQAALKNIAALKIHPDSPQNILSMSQREKTKMKRGSI